MIQRADIFETYQGFIAPCLSSTRPHRVVSTPLFTVSVSNIVPCERQRILRPAEPLLEIRYVPRQLHPGYNNDHDGSGGLTVASQA